MNIIIGNIVALISSILVVYIGTIKNKQKIIIVQTIQIIISIISNIILGGITGAIINSSNCIRNILCCKNKLTFKLKILLILITIIVSLKFNKLGLIGFLPLISTIIYTLLIETKDIIKFKQIYILCMFLWFIYDLFIQSYTSSIFDFLTIITSTIAIHQLSKKRT